MKTAIDHWFTVLYLGATLLVCGALHFLLAPKVYRATARVVFSRNYTDPSDDQSHTSFADVDAYFVENEAHLILSPRVLYEVINNLQMGDPKNGEPLRSDLGNMDRICRHLKRRIHVIRTSDTCVLGIEVAWSKGNESAKIANEIATTYTKITNRSGWRAIAFEIEEAKSNLKEFDQMLNSQKGSVSHFQPSVGASRADRLRYFFERNYLNGLLRRREAVSNHIDDL